MAKNEVLKSKFLPRMRFQASALKSIPAMLKTIDSNKERIGIERIAPKRSWGLICRANK